MDERMNEMNDEVEGDPSNFEESEKKGVRKRCHVRKLLLYFSSVLIRS